MFRQGWIPIDVLKVSILRLDVRTCPVLYFQFFVSELPSPKAS